MSLNPALPGIAERFTIGRVFALSWRAFVARRWLFLIVATFASMVCTLQNKLTEGSHPYESAWSFLFDGWFSGSVQMLAIVLITVGVLGRDREQHAGMVYWLKAICATLILQAIAYWPVALLLVAVAAKDRSAVNYIIVAINLVAVTTLLYLFFPVFLREGCSIWNGALRSIHLVMSHVWRILALNIMGWLAYLGGSVIVLNATNSWDREHPGWTYYMGEWALMSLLLLATTIMPAVAYHLLRLEREGPDPSHLARVFE